MKITQVKLGRISTPLRVPFKTALRTVSSVEDVIVELHTDTGAVGYGEAPPTGVITGDTTGAILGAIQDHIAPALLGRDLDEFEDLTAAVQKALVHNTSAKAAVDMALWDIKGKALGVPVYELLGGKTRDKVRVYASVMHITEDKNELAAQYQQLQQMGFTAAKIFCNGPTSSPDGKGEFFSSRIEREVEKVRVCREAVGPDFDFILEVHRGMTLPEAVAFGRAVEPSAGQCRYYGRSCKQNRCADCYWRTCH